MHHRPIKSQHSSTILDCHGLDNFVNKLNVICSDSLFLFMCKISQCSFSFVKKVSRSITVIHCHSILQSYPFYDLVLHTAILSDGTLCLWGTDWLHSTQDQRQIPDKHCKKILMFDLTTILMYHKKLLSVSAPLNGLLKCNPKIHFFPL